MVLPPAKRVKVLSLVCKRAELKFSKIGSWLTLTVGNIRTLIVVTDGG